MDTLEQIPFTYVGPVIKADLARKLDVFDRNGKDWRGLADLLDFTADEIEHIKALTHSGSNTEKLFDNYIRAEESSVGHVLSSLRKLGREDAYKILHDNIRSIIEKYERKTRRKVNWLSRQASFGSPTDNRIQPSYPMTGLPAGHPSGSGAVMGTPFSNQGITYASMPYVVPQQPSGAPVPTADNWNIPPVGPPAMYHSLRNESRSYGSMIPNVQRSASYRPEDIEMNELSTSYGSTGPMNTAPLPFVEGLVRAENQMVSMGVHSEFGSLAQMDPQVPMLKSGGFFGQIKQEPENEDPDTEGSNHSMDEATRLRVEQWLRNVNPSNTGDDSKETTSHLPPVQDSSHRAGGTSGKHKLTHSDENGGPSKKFSSARDNVRRGKVSSKASHGGVQGLVMKNRDNGRNTPQSTGKIGDDERCNSAEKCISDPTTIRPTCLPHPAKKHNYNTWPESKSEEKLRKKGREPKQPILDIQRPTQPRGPCTQIEHYQNKNTPMSNPQSPEQVVQSHVEDVEMTYCQSRGQQDVDQMLTQFKAMSMSMPNGMKPAPHKEGKRKIRVFITYSQDDKRHTQRVINLCDCLRKNNFQPCIDMFEKVKIAQDKHGWIDKKFKEVIDLCDIPPECGLEWCHLLPHVTFRVLAAGGDGTVGWILNAIDNLKLKPTPQVCILPLGTGNDLSRVLGWGEGYAGDVDVKYILNEMEKAKPVNLDRWKVQINHLKHFGMRRPRKEFVMNNYVSIGVDALVTLNFHKHRESSPILFSNRVINKESRFPKRKSNEYEEEYGLILYNAT